MGLEEAFLLGGIFVIIAAVSVAVMIRASKPINQAVAGSATVEAATKRTSKWL